jgi:predicted N-acetyltransferase YhbS
MNLRAGTVNDADELGRICFEAFASIANKHNFPPDFPSPEVAAGLMEVLLARPDVYSVVAEDGGRIMGSNFLWESDVIAGVGPITVDPEVQDSSLGRAMMEDILRRADEQGFLSVRLVQGAYHSRSLALYTKLGFNTVEPLSNIQGGAINVSLPGFAVRPMLEDDVEAADRVCRSVHGHSRRNEIAGALRMGSAMVVTHQGRITGYTSGLNFFGHTVGESNKELMALIGAVSDFGSTGFLLPTRNSELLRWCLGHGLRIVQPLTLMSRGIYQEPKGAFLPSIVC